MSRYPDDFTLFEIGEWDDDKGSVTMFETKKSLGLAIEYKKTKNMELINEVNS